MAPGSVIIQTPPGTVTTTQGYGGSVRTTQTIPASGTTAATVLIQSPLPTLGCDPSGYLIQAMTLIRVNITTGTSVVVKSSVYGNNINSIGYNVADNFIYGSVATTPFQSLIRIGANGDSNIVASLNSTLEYNCGDVDEKSIYWATLNGRNWTQLDLVPGSANFGKLIANGTTTTLPAGYTVYDWAYVPGGGNNLYGIAQNGAKSQAILMAFSRSTKEWTELTNYNNVTGLNQFGALYASDDGFLFGSENNAGQSSRSGSLRAREIEELHYFMGHVSGFPP